MPDGAGGGGGRNWLPETATNFQAKIEGIIRSWFVSNLVTPIVKWIISIGSFVLAAAVIPLDVLGDSVALVWGTIYDVVSPIIYDLNVMLGGLAYAALPENAGVFAPLIMWISWAVITGATLYIAGQALAVLDPR